MTGDRRILVHDDSPVRRVVAEPDEEGDADVPGVPSIC